MLNLIIAWLKGIPKEFLVMVVAALPISELRGAIPLAYYSFGFNPIKAYWISVLGNIIPVIPLLFFLKPFSDCLRKFKVWSRFFDWFFERTREKAEKIQKYEVFGLAMFVAIPLPGTGAWAAAVVASLLKIRFRYAFIAIVSGVICAGGIVLALCILGIMTWKAVIK